MAYTIDLLIDCLASNWDIHLTSNIHFIKPLHSSLFTNYAGVHFHINFYLITAVPNKIFLESFVVASFPSAFLKTSVDGPPFSSSPFT